MPILARKFSHHRKPIYPSSFKSSRRPVLALSTRQRASTNRPSEVRYWHEADMFNALTNVRFWGQSGHGPTAAYQTRFMSTRPRANSFRQTTWSFSVRSGKVRRTSSSISSSEASAGPERVSTRPGAARRAASSFFTLPLRFTSRHALQRAFILSRKN